MLEFTYVDKPKPKPEYVELASENMEPGTLFEWECGSLGVAVRGRPGFVLLNASNGKEAFSQGCSHTRNVKRIIGRVIGLKIELAE